MTGRGWAYLGALLGGVASVAANVAHSYVPPTSAGPGWAPHTGAVIGAIFWPVFLFVAVEIVARVLWPAGRRWAWLRFGGMVPVALVAALVSYKHLAGLLTYYGYDPLTATLGPFAVDGLMVMATGALIATARTTTTVEPTPVVVPQTEPAPSPLAAVPAPVSSPKPSKPTAKRSAPAAGRTPTADRVAAAVAKSPDATPAQIAARLKVSERTVQRYLPRPTDPADVPAAA